MSGLYTETREVLRKYGVRLRRSLGQNYLIDEVKRQRILEYADLKEDDRVLEIGPGIGTLTLPMAELAGHVTAIESDPLIAAILMDRLQVDNVDVIVGDALRVDFPEFNKVVSNLPYQISSPITFRLLEHDFELAVLMYQKEFARRMVAEPGTREYSRLSVMVHFLAEVEIVDYLKPGCFFPRPRVESAIVTLKPTGFRAPAFLEDVCRALFQHRKKKTSKSLRESFHEIRTDLSFNEVLRGLPPEILEKRVFQLRPEEILEIAEHIDDISGSS